MRLWVVCFSLFVLLVSLAPQPCEAQVLYGSLVGNVKDATEAAVAGAVVTITNIQTNQSRQTLTNDVGGYSLPTVEPGTYTLRVTKEGFSTHTQSDVVVSINSITRVDVGLKVGAVTETVTVTTNVATLQTDRSEVRAEITSGTFQNLPVAVGRNYQQLFRMLPGFRPPTNAHSVPTNPARALTFNVNGVSQSINNTRIDGASSISPWLPHITAFVPTLEAIDTVNIVTNSFDAEQGLAGGAAINVQIRSGTNGLHGSVFENYTGNKLKAKPWILPPGQRKPKLVDNEFGGTLGGPIKKDRLFYFMSYEGNLHHEFASRLATVPTAAIKRGDMSDSTRPIYDPASGDERGNNRTEFLNRIVPLARQSAITRKLADLTPLPNLDLLTNNYFGNASYAFDRHRADTKVNWNINEKWTAFSRFSINHYDMTNPQIFGDLGGPEISGAGGNPGSGTGNTFSFTGATTYIFTPHLILDAYFGWTRMDTSVEQARLDEKLGQDFLGIPGTNGTRRFEGGWPQFDISSYTTLGMPNNFMPYYRRDPQFQYVANFNWTRGTHEIRYGTDIYFNGMNHLQPEVSGGASYGAQGGFDFGSGPTQSAQGPSGNQFNSYATFLLGLPTTIGKIHMVPDEYSTHQRNYSFYIRDRWNPTSKLTLSYGLRWEYFPFPTRADRGLEWYDASTNKMLVCGIGQVPRDCGVSVSKRLFAPRVGVAYRATNTLVLRAGYGITYDPFSLQRPFRTNYPVLLIQTITSPNSFSWAGRIADGIPRVPVPDLGNGIIDVPGTVIVFNTPKKFDRGYVQSWNFTVQKQLPYNFTGSAGYVATRSIRQIGYLNLNAGQIIGAGNDGRPLRAKYSRTADTLQVTGLGTTQYNSLQATLQRRFSQGLQVETNYTWSKVIGITDNSDNEPTVKALNYFNLNRVVRGYDRTHMLHVSQIWDLPFGKGKRLATSGPLAQVLGGWQVNQLLSFYSGTPFGVSTSGTSLNLPGSSQRADQVKPNVQKLGGTGRGLSFFDPFAFAPVTEPRFGTAGFNALRGPGLINWDFGVHRRFQLTERVQMQFRMEAFNFSNTPHFANPGTSRSAMDVDPVTGQIVRLNGYTEITGVTNLARDGIDERQFRLGLRFSF